MPYGCTVVCKELFEGRHPRTGACPWSRDARSSAVSVGRTAAWQRRARIWQRCNICIPIKPLPPPPPPPPPPTVFYFLYLSRSLAAKLHTAVKTLAKVASQTHLTFLRVLANIVEIFLDFLSRVKFR